MITITNSKSTAAALSYFDPLTQGDYYMGTECSGQWHGKGAEYLGLETGSEVTKEQFANLLAGFHPNTKEKLAQRLGKNRRPGFDITFSVPKSLSMLWAINEDETILEILRETVHETMRSDVEPLMARRVRHGKNVATQQKVKTGNLIYSDFLHKTARPVNGKADPQLHTHAFVMNQTVHDGKNYAAEPEQIFREKKAIQNKFLARLGRRVKQELGTDLIKTRNGWEVKGLHDRLLIEKFSQRTKQIEDFAKEHGIEDAATKATLGAKLREKKDKGTSIGRLRSEWRSRLTPEEQKAFDGLKNGQGAEQGDETKTIKAAVDFALKHHLYRQSTVEKHMIVATALQHGVTITPEDVEAVLDQDGIIHCTETINGVERCFVTTDEVLDAETNMITFARDGRGTRRTIARSEHVFSREWLNDEQKAAVNHILQSRDRVTAITGGAGTGKSSLMEEAAEGIRAGGKNLFVFAPSTGAKEVLQNKGFKDAQTVEHLLRNDQLHPELKDGVIWIDESSLLDVRSMLGIFAIAKEQNARVVLSGDTKQHSSPRRGEAMRLLEREAGLNIARIETIQRQKGRYKQAVELISLGHEIVDQKTGLTGMLAGYDMLDRMGKLKEIPSEHRHDVLAKRYLKSLKRKRSTLIVAPTHAEGHSLTEIIRDRLRETGAIGAETQEKEFTQLRSLNLSEAEKGESTTYDLPNLVVQMHQNVKGNYKRGERYRVCRDQEGKPALRPIKGGVIKPLPVDVPERFEVYSETAIRFAPGDKIRFSLGGTATDQKRRISNGRLDEIKGFNQEGNIVLKSGMVVDRNYGHLDRGYVITSHAAQGKDASQTLTAIGAQSLPAVNAKQFYVSASRGIDNCTIYVDDKEAVRRAIQEAGEQRSATEMVGGQGAEDGHAVADQVIERRAFLDRVRQWWQTHRPEREAALSRNNNNSLGQHNTPTLSRS